MISFLILPFFVFAQEGGVAGDNTETANQSTSLNKSLSSLEKIARGAGYENVSLISLIALIVRTALSLLGVIFIILIVVSGYKWLTAGGDETDVSNAKKYIKRAIIGLIITLSSWGIWLFIYNRLM